MIGAEIGQYRVMRMIGSGGMGAVYAAEHALLGRSAAIKVLLPELSQKQEVVLRFFNEARAATAIRHPGIVEIYDFGWTGDGAAFIVMEYLEGESLARRAARARLAWPTVLVIARQIAGALAAAHAKGIVHRDVKPDNVFLIPDPEVPGGERIKLLDFGIAKLLGDSPTTPTVTRTGATLGTPTYMAPEQCRGVAVDHRADLYSLGCVMYELCCGRPPFVGEGAGDVLAAHIHLPVPPMTGAAPPAVEQLIALLLAKSPVERVQSAPQLIQRIDAIAGDPSVSGTLPVRFSMPAGTLADPNTTLSGSVSSMQLPRASRRRWAMIAVPPLLAAVTVVAVSLVMQRSDDAGRAGGSDRPAREAPLARVSEATASAVPSPVPAEASAAVPVAQAAGSPAPANAAEPAAANAAGSSAPANAAEGAAANAAGSSAPANAAEGAAANAAGSSAPANAAERAAENSAAGNGAVGNSAVGNSAVGNGAVANRAAANSAARDTSGAATVPVAIDSDPSGAQVVLGGRVLGTTPFRGTLARGERDVRLVVRMTGYGEHDVVARPSRAIREHVVLLRSGAAKPAKADRDRSVNPF